MKGEKNMSEKAVREASDGFYKALDRMFQGDVKPMYDVLCTMCGPTAPT